MCIAPRSNSSSLPTKSPLACQEAEPTSPTNSGEPQRRSPLNIAEGAGEFSPGDKARFYRMARRSATECAAILDACRATELAELDLLFKGRTLLLRIVAMLTAMVLRLNDPGSGSGAGSGST